MAKNPAVSVIVPVYNVEIYIRQCVDSILKQTFQDFEIILVNDATPDKSFALCKELYGDNEKVRFISHEENRGLGEARNTGMKNARGKYICFVDSDDFILRNALENFYNAAEKTNAQVVHASGWYELNQDEPEPLLKKNLKLMWERDNQEGFLPFNVPYRLNRNWKAMDTWSMAWLCFCRRDFLAENHIEFLPILSEDEPFAFALYSLAEKYYVLHKPLYVYRRRSGSIMKSTALDKFPKGINTLLAAPLYIKKFLDRVPRFKGYDAWREGIIRTCFIRFSPHTSPYYRDLNLTAEKDSIIEAALAPVFGENADFVKFFFNQYNLEHWQAERLKQRNKNLSAQMMTLFNRLELSPTKIVFNNFLGKGYGCNPKYIAEEILRQNLPYDLVWLVRDLNEPMPEKIRKVLWGGVDSLYEIATAKVIVSNVKNLLPYPHKKQGQYFIMTWHGGGGFKKVEQDAEKTLSPAYVRETKINSKITDLMLAGCQEQLEEMRRAFWYDGEILKCGVPRNDLFFRRNGEFVARIRKNLNVPDGNKIIMFAPTFRNNPAVLADVYKFDASKLLKVMRKKFGGAWTLFIRLHPNISQINPKNFFGDAENFIDVTNYPDMQELTMVADVLISDYSGVIYDFMISRKPVFIYAKDFETYPKERGFKQLYFDLPYKVNRTEAELFNCIKTFDFQKLEPAIKKFTETIQPFDTGHASEEVVKRIKAVIGSNLPIVKDMPREILNAADDWKVYTYVKEKYSAYLNSLPVYESQEATPKIFWWCWLQGAENAPPLCKLCLKSLRKNYPDYQINIVTQKNMLSFVRFPKHIVDKVNARKITATHLSDLLRLELLINHGGTWIDSTVFCTGREQNYLREPLFIFQNTWRNAPAHLGSSWFIVSQKGNPILRTTRDLLYKYWEDHDELGAGGFYFLFHCMFKLAAEKYSELWREVPPSSNVPPHLLQFSFFDRYDPDRFEQIKNGSHFHKLTWKYPPQLLSSPRMAGTYYEHLMKFYS